MKTNKERIDFILKGVDEAVSNKLNPKLIVMHSSTYRSLSLDNKQMFNAIFGLDVKIDDSAPIDYFYIF